MFKNFIMKQMLKRQMKDVAPEDQERIFKAIEKNPQFFEKVAVDIKKRVDSGQDQISAAMEVMRENQEELKKVLQ